MLSYCFQPQNGRYSNPLDSANFYMALLEQTIPYSLFKYPLICFGDHFFSSFLRQKRKTTHGHFSNIVPLLSTFPPMIFVWLFGVIFTINANLLYLSAPCIGTTTRNSAMERISVPFRYITSIANLSSETTNDDIFFQ